MAIVDAKRLNVAVEILDDYCEVFDNKEYDLLSENEKTLLFNATVLIEKIVVRMQNHGDYSLIKNHRLLDG